MAGESLIINIVLLTYLDETTMEILEYFLLEDLIVRAGHDDLLWNIEQGVGRVSQFGQVQWEEVCQHSIEYLVDVVELGLGEHFCHFLVLSALQERKEVFHFEQGLEEVFSQWTECSVVEVYVVHDEDLFPAETVVEEDLCERFGLAELLEGD